MVLINMVVELLAFEFKLFMVKSKTKMVWFPSGKATVQQKDTQGKFFVPVNILSFFNQTTYQKSA